MNIPETPSLSTLYGNIPVGYASGVSLATNVRRLRRAAELTQAALSDRIGIGQSSISKWEKGQTDPELEMLPRLARALGVTVDELIRGVDVEYDAQLQSRDPVGRTPTTVPDPVKKSSAHRAKQGAKSVESVLHHPLPQNQRPGEGSAYADSSASDPPDSRPDSTTVAARSAKIKADVRSAFEARLITRLFAAAEAVADALRHRATAPPLRTKRPVVARSDSRRPKRGGRRA
jgi:transcriptional regulator with XRE-family HTH domain